MAVALQHFEYLPADYAEAYANLDPEELLDQEPWLTVNVGEWELVESNADDQDEETGELFWTKTTVETDGVFFEVRRPVLVDSAQP